MADTDVVLHMRFDGADKAAADMDRLAQRTKGAGEAAKQAEQNYQRMTGAAGGGDLLGNAERRYREQQARILGSPPPGVPWGPVGPSSLTMQMQAYQRQLAAYGTPPPPGVGTGPGAGVPPGGGGGGSGGSTLEDRIIGRFTRVFFILSTVQRSFEGVGKGLEETAEKNLSYADSVRAVGRNVAEAIPFFGGLVKGLEAIGNAVSGITSERAFAGQFATAAERQIAFAHRAGAGRARGAEELFQIQRGATDAGIGLDVAQAQLAGLTPGVLAGFRDPTTGAAQQAVFAAQGGAAAAAARAAARRAEFDAARAAAAPLTDIANEAQRRASGADVRAIGLGRPGAGEQIGVGNLFAVQNGPLAQRRERETALIGAQASADAASLQLIQARVNQERALTEEKKRGHELQKAENDLAAADLKLSEARLGVRRADAEQQKRSAEFAGLAGPGDQEVTLAAIRQAKAGGLGSLPPSLRQRLLADPDTGDFTRDLARQAGQNDPTRAAIREAVGRGPLQDTDRLIDDINREQGENAVKYARAIRDVVANTMDDLKDAIQESISAEASRVANEIRAKFLQGKPP